MSIKNKKNLSESSEGSNYIVKKSGRPNKDILFKNEKIKVVKKINKIIGIDNDNDFFYVEDVTDGQINDILDLMDDVKKFFAFSGWSFFRNKQPAIPYLSLIRNVYKSAGFTFNKKLSHEIVEGVKIKKTKIFINLEK